MFCCAAGRVPKPATVRSCWSPASPVSASPGLLRHWRSAFVPSRTRGYAINARPITATASCTLCRGAGARRPPCPRDPAETQLEKLEAILAPARIAETAPLFASLLSIPTGGRYPPLALSAVQQRRLTLAALLDQLEALTRERPVLMLFEDAHWADATSLEVLDLTVERVRTLPVLVLITFRPEYEAPWTGLSHVTSIALDRLAPAEIETLAMSVARRPLPPRWRRRSSPRPTGCRSSSRN
jgi:hypothetical protein